MKVKISHGRKSAYRYLQYAGYVSVKEFVIAEQEEKKYLLIRFANDTSFQINSLEYTVIQLNDKGEELRKTKQTKSELLFESEGEYTTTEGVIVDDSCADIKVEIENFVSGSIRYRFENGELEGEYLRSLPPIVEAKGKIKQPYKHLCVYEKKDKSSRKATLIAIIGYLLLLGATFAPPIWELIVKTFRP